MLEPSDEWESKLDISPEQRISQSREFGESREFGGLAKLAESQMSENDFTLPCEGSCEEDDEFTESKIKEFLDEKVSVLFQAMKFIPFIASTLLISVCFLDRPLI